MKRELHEDIVDYLNYQKQLGVKYYSKSVLCAPQKDSSVLAQTTNSCGLRFSELENETHNCTKCGLSRGRTTVVFGTGNRKARLMLIGEGPGYDEDIQGKPFVGKAGMLLTKILKAINLERDEVYIANIVKCRPPNNRTPLPDEIAACKPYIEEQISLIQPKIICALGYVAANTLLGIESSISKLRGKFYDYKGIKLMPTFHPAYLLRNPEKKKEVWEDVQKIQRELNA